MTGVEPATELSEREGPRPSEPGTTSWGLDSRSDSSQIESSGILRLDLADDQLERLAHPLLGGLVLLGRKHANLPAQLVGHPQMYTNGTVGTNGIFCTHGADGTTDTALRLLCPTAMASPARRTTLRSPSCFTCKTWPRLESHSHWARDNSIVSPQLRFVHSQW
jgi:hypothetical protein